MQIRLTALALCLPAAAMAQQANISRTDVTTSGFNANTSMQNAPGTAVYVPNDGNTVLLVKNNTASNITATQKTQATQMSQAGYGAISLSDVAVTVPSNSVVVLGPYPQGRWNNPYAATEVDLSTATGVSVTALRVPK